MNRLDSSRFKRDDIKTSADQRAAKGDGAGSRGLDAIDERSNLPAPHVEYPQGNLIAAGKGVPRYCRRHARVACIEEILVIEKAFRLRQMDRTSPKAATPCSG